jgi:hypothetical protein
MRPLLPLFAALAALGCASGPKPMTESGPAHGASHALPFIENDFSAALAQARREGRPLFVDAWAPW